MVRETRSILLFRVMDDPLRLVPIERYATVNYLIGLIEMGAINCARTILNHSPELATTYCYEKDAYPLDCVAHMHVDILEMIFQAADKTGSHIPANTLGRCLDLVVYNTEKDSLQKKAHFLIEHGVYIPKWYPQWVHTYVVARKVALDARKRAAFCMMTHGIRQKFWLSKDVARLLSKAVMQVNWRGWMAT